MSFAQSYQRTVLELDGVLRAWSEFDADERASYRDEFEWLLIRRRDEFARAASEILPFDVVLLGLLPRVESVLGLDVASYLTTSASIEKSPGPPTLETADAELALAA